MGLDVARCPEGRNHNHNGTLGLILGCFHLLEQPRLSWAYSQIPFSLLALLVPSSNSSPALSNPLNHPWCLENLQAALSKIPDSLNVFMDYSLLPT